MKYKVVSRTCIEYESRSHYVITLHGDLSEETALMLVEKLTIIRPVKEGIAFVIGAIVDLSLST